MITLRLFAFLAIVQLCLAQGTPQAGGGTGSNSGSGSVAVQANGVAVGSEPILNYIGLAGITNSLSDTGGKINIQQGVDYSVTLSNAAAQAGTRLTITTTSSSGTTYTGTMSPTLTAYTKDMDLTWDVGTTGCTGAATINIDSVGAVSLKEANGSTDPTPADCPPNQIVKIAFDGTVMRMLTTTPSTLRAGGFAVMFRGADATAASTVYLTIPYACTINGWAITADSTATIKLWRVATGGTARPTVANTLSTSGFSLASGTRIASTTVSDLSSTAIAAYDTFGINLFASASTDVEFTLGCLR